ncbi:MAG: Trp family transcriptional regulator [Patescibacteria group bacterium]|nr:trp operon repressor [Patescibacteria group bacterium]
MARVSHQSTAQNLSAIARSLESAEEKLICFSALLGNKTLELIGRKLAIIELLEQEIPYTEISQRLGVSSATIASVTQNMAPSVRQMISAKLHQEKKIDRLTNQIWKFLPDWLK